MSRGATVSSKIIVRFAGAATVAGLLLPANASLGQEPNSAPPAQTAPRVLIPVEQAPLAAMPAAPPASESMPAPAPMETQAPVGIPMREAAVQVGDLGTIEGPVAGTLDNSNGGLGPTAWQASDRGAVVTMLQSLPDSTPSAAYRLLMRKVLLTAAAPPPGRSNVSFNRLRLTKLLEGGYLEDAANLALRIQAPMNLDILRAQTDALLDAGRDMEACSDVTAHRLDSAESFWVQLRAYCYATIGDSGPLELTRAVIQAQGLADPAFVSLLDGMINGKPAAPSTMRYPDSIHVVMMSKQQLPMTPEIATGLGTPASLLTAMSMATPRPLRVAAAEKLLRAGALPTPVLADILDSATFTPQELDGAVALARSEPLMNALARLRAAFKAAATDTSRAELLHASFETAEREGLLAQVADVYANDASQIMPAADWANWSEMMVRALLLAGKAEAAQRWFDILDRNAPGMADTVDQLELSLALVAPNARRTTGARRLLEEMALVVNPPPEPMIAAPQPMPDPMAADPMMPDAMPSPPPAPPPPPPRPKPPQALVARATLDLGLFDALGELNSRDAQTAVQPLLAEQSPGRRPDLALMQRIDKAALSDARGETVLAVLSALGPQGARDLAPDVAVRLARALQTAGMRDAAHVFATEAFLLRPRAGAAASP
jgi:hypothetical protein